MAISDSVLSVYYIVYMDIIQCLMLQNWVETPKLNKLSHKAEQSIQ